MIREQLGVPLLRCLDSATVLLDGARNEFGEPPQRGNRLGLGWRLRDRERPGMTTREVADLLGLSPETVLRRWRAGELPGFRLRSNVLRFDRDEVIAWLHGMRVSTLSDGDGRREHAR
jgi:excisionase family DNA binding protein